MDIEASVASGGGNSVTPSPAYASGAKSITVQTD